MINGCIPNRKRNVASAFQRFARALSMGLN
jgi:hypothetical protein